jgi:hypothetical protein
MHLKTVKLDHSSYQDYLEGKEIHCEAGKLTTKEVEEGEHIMVYKDTVATNTNISLPRGEMQAEYIGVEGMITKVLKSTEHHEGVMIRKI